MNIQERLVQKKQNAPVSSGGAGHLEVDQKPRQNSFAMVGPHLISGSFHTEQGLLGSCFQVTRAAATCWRGELQQLWR